MCSAQRAILPTLWPGGLGRPESCGFDLQVRNDWRYIPETLDEICDWAGIGQDDIDDPSCERNRRYLIHDVSLVPEEFKDRECRVTIVLQGFLGKFNLAPLGNWKGSITTLVCLVQVSLTVVAVGTRKTHQARSDISSSSLVVATMLSRRKSARSRI